MFVYFYYRRFKYILIKISLNRYKFSKTITKQLIYIKGQKIWITLRINISKNYIYTEKWDYLIVTDSLGTTMFCRQGRQASGSILWKSGLELSPS